MTTYTHAGVSRLNGEFKVRFANDALRVKVLAKNGHTDIDIVELKHAMSKEDAIAFLMDINFANGNAEVEQALAAEILKRAEKPAKEPKVKAVKEAKPKAAKPAAKKVVVKPAAVVKAEQTEDEDAPF